MWSDQHFPVQGSSSPFSLVLVAPDHHLSTWQNASKTLPKPNSFSAPHSWRFASFGRQDAINTLAFLNRCLLGLSLRPGEVCAPRHGGAGTFPIRMPGKAEPEGGGRRCMS